MKVFVTGGTGFIGYHLLDAMLTRNWRVKSLARPTSNIPEEYKDQVEFVIGDLLEPESLQGLMDDVDLIIHMAGLIKATTFASFKSVNTQGTKNILEAAESSTGSDPKFIFLSSMSAAGPSKDKTAIKEDITPQPVSWYGKSKLLAEERVKKSELDHIIIRPAAVYGPGDRESLIFFQLAKYHIIPKIGGSKHYLSLIHVRDLVDLILKAVTNKEAYNQIYNASDNQNGYSWKKMINTAAQSLATWTLPIYIPRFIVSLAAYISTVWGKISRYSPMFTRDKYREMIQQYWLFSSQKAEEELNFSPQYDLEKGFHETANWYQEKNWL